MSLDKFRWSAPALIASASGIALMATGVAHAQTAEEERVLEAVVVEGQFSAGLGRALDAKRNADSISDAIVAADIGKLPAVNVAEALQRVPGVTIVREAGEGQFISVRGLGPNFQSVTLNGMPMAYNENIRNSGQSGRQFRLQVLPSDLIDGIIVTKTPTADLVEGGIGSSVDIRLLNPLDRESFVGVSGYAGYEERTDTIKPNGSIAGGWRNAAQTFGVMGGLSYSEREVQFDRLVSGWSDATIPGLGTVRVPGDIQPYLELENRDRISAVGGIQWRPTPELEIDIDGFYSLFNNEVTERRLTYYIPSQISRLDLDTAVVEDGRLVAGTINGARIRNYAEYLDQAHENTQLNLSVSYDIAGWTLQPRVSYAVAKSDLKTPIQRVQYRTANAAGGNLTFDFRGDPAGDAKIRALFTDLDLTDPSLMPFESFAVRPINSEDEDKTFTFDATRDLDFNVGGVTITRFKAGVQASDRFRNYQRRDRSSTVLRDGVTRTDAFLGAPVPSNAFDQSIGTFQPWTNIDWNLFNASYVLRNEFDGVNPSAYDLTPTSADLQNSYYIEEQIAAAYARFDFGSSFQGVPFTGNAGLRYVTTDTAVDGTTVAPVANADGSVSTQVTPTRTDNTYEELLPSLNVSFELTNDILLRLGAAKTMTRPSLSELRNSINTNSVTVTNIFRLGAAALEDPTLNLNASAGNPELSPYTSWNLDMSFEWYFDQFGAFTVAAFHKDLSNYIASDFQTRTLAFAVNDGTTLPVDILVATPTNVGDAAISGLEFAFTNKLEMGLGLSATATFATSKLELDKAGVGVQSAGIQGVSDTSYSITPFFERGPFEVNLSYTYRSDYLTDTGAVVTSQPTAADVVPFYQKGYGILDMGTSYQLTDKLEVFAQAVNLLDNRQVSFAGTEDEVTQIHTYGRTFNIGARYRF
ncbi:MAG: TonB-dependent receptor [Pararhodobacter sp.]